MAEQSKSDVGGRAEFIGKRNKRVRSSVVGDPEEINRIMDQEFNPVKPTEAVLSEERAKTEIPTHHIETHILKSDKEQPEPQIKTTAAYDNSRLEFLRMQIGPVQNFYQTLGNILFSLSMRLDVAEAKIESLKVQYDQVNLERALYKRYADYCHENNLSWSQDGFIDFIREYAKEEEDETRIEN